MINNSPWIFELNKARKANKLDSDVKTDIAIVGGGIAGVSTAFFILRNTAQKVILLEGGRLGHGATGHNAGQITSYFARSFHDLVSEFGMDMTSAAHKNIETDAWQLLDIMYKESGINIPLARFNGHLGFSSLRELTSALVDNALRLKAGLELKEILVAHHAEFLIDLESKYSGLFKTASHEDILSRLETRRKEFIACLTEEKGTMNSALFTEKIAAYLLERYPERFSIYENTHISKVVLHDDKAVLDAGTQTVEAARVVLCTNGFDNLTIFNKSGLDIDTRFHHSLHAIIGYMSGYLGEPAKPPTAISYLYKELSGDEASGDPYIYLTRRLYEYRDGKHDLISIGGPDTSLEDRREYERDEEYPEWAKDEIDKFVRTVYREDPEGEIDYLFTWHGLMGYTSNKVRLVGAEPKNPVLLYNLGCNGVGLLPSIFGGDRISQILAGENLLPSIFDPRISEVDQGLNAAVKGRQF
jgi:glycine/D-amino acid oxidase-like deaminating enzyme